MKYLEDYPKGSLVLASVEPLGAKQAIVELRAPDGTFFTLYADVEEHEG